MMRALPDAGARESGAIYFVKASAALGTITIPGAADTVYSVVTKVFTKTNALFLTC